MSQLCLFSGLQSIIFDEVDLTDASVAESSTKNVNNSFTVSRSDLGPGQRDEGGLPQTRTEACAHTSCNTLSLHSNTTNCSTVNKPVMLLL